MSFLARCPSQSPTVWRLPSYSGPEICECRQRQISQLDHGRLRVTRESSSHLPDQPLCETTLHQLIASPVFASTLGGVRSGSEQKWATCHSAIFLAVYSKTTGNFHPLQHSLSGWLVSTFAFDSSELCVALRERSGEGLSPFRLDTMALSIPGHLSADVTTLPTVNLILVRRRNSAILWP